MRKLKKQVQTPLSQKEKAFSKFVFAFPKCASNLEEFQEKDEYSSLIISEIIDSERGDYLNI